jgi:uncharacterized phiE125 gp8 family phage protein
MATGDLTTVDELRAWLGVTGTGEDAAILAPLVTAASTFAREWMTRDILSASYVETLDGLGNDRVMLKQYPVTAVSAVSVDGVALPVSTAFNVSGFQFDDIGVYLIGYTFTRARRNVQISYTAGYASTPLDLKQAVLELCAYKYQQRARIGVVSRGLAGEMVTYSQKDMPETVKTTLSYYQRVWPQ